jgi:hypothetical protein
MPDSFDVDILGPDKPSPPSPKPKEWDPTTFHAPHTRSGPKTDKVTPPAVPGERGKGGRTVVDTPSLDLFASNMDKLAEPVKEAYNRLLKLQTVAPGAFFDAYKLREATSGADGSQGIQATYLKILHDLGQGLADIGSGSRQLSKNYSTTEEENKMSADEVSTAMESAQGDFSKLNSGG